jgi:hypothetical protein
MSVGRQTVVGVGEGPNLSPRRELFDRLIQAGGGRHGADNNSNTHKSQWDIDVHSGVFLGLSRRR